MLFVPNVRENSIAIGRIYVINHMICCVLFAGKLSLRRKAR
jgi:hypothetical protein